MCASSVSWSVDRGYQIEEVWKGARHQKEAHTLKALVVRTPCVVPARDLVRRFPDISVGDCHHYFANRLRLRENIHTEWIRVLFSHIGGKKAPRTCREPSVPESFPNGIPEEDRHVDNLPALIGVHSGHDSESYGNQSAKPDSPQTVTVEKQSVTPTFNLPTWAW